MSNDLPTRVCDGCGQIWSSGRFLDPTSEVDCGFCGAGLVHRRRVPNGLTVELQRLSEQTPSTVAAGHSMNGASATVSPRS